MPTYDFQCQRCGRFFDGRMTMTEYEQGVRPRCPDCADASPLRAFSATVNILTSRGGSSASSCEQPGSGASAAPGSCGCC